MAKPSTRTYSRYSRDAARLLGMMIRTARIESRLTIEELAERAGVSRGLVYRAEEGDMGCAIGAVFELATIVGVRCLRQSVLLWRYILLMQRKRCH